MASRALSFGAIAEAYERFRLGYPDELVDAVVGYADRPILTALEIGAGTGKASRLFAARGVTVTASEPDAAMLTELRKHAPGNVITVQAGLEDLSLATTYGLIYAAASLHWTRRDGRWERIAALSDPGAVFACFGGPVELADPDLAETVRAARAPYLETDDVAPASEASMQALMQWPGSELAESPWFTDTQQTVIERRLTVTAQDYVGQLSTVSAYLMLPQSQRSQAMASIVRVLPAHLEINADITLHLARRNACSMDTATPDPGDGAN